MISAHKYSREKLLFGLFLLSVLFLSVNFVSSEDLPLDYLDSMERFIQDNPGSFNYSEQTIHSGQDYFASIIKQITLVGENFTSYEKTLILYSSVDTDGDGFIIYTYPGLSPDGADCNDKNPEIYPDAPEFCNGLDDNCDGQMDENVCECNDGIDNDHDDLMDEEDPGCWTDSRDPSSYSLSFNDEQRARAACSSSSDCGVDQPFGNQFCIFNDVYQNYADFVCMNRGTGNAECGVDVSRILISYCMNGCQDGRCIGEIPGEQLYSSLYTEPEHIELSPNQVKTSVAPKANPLLFYLILLFTFAVLTESFLIRLLRK